MPTGARKSCNFQLGAAVPEYVLLLGILIPIFVIIGLLLQNTAIRSGERSAGSVTDVVPCGPQSGLAAGTEECM
ncbi:MAG: hypothetical protein J5J00_10630 [Deltaproteobacteria bacterium]|nr:hypothetical protein [Deltaproteobacteria bacterium]